MSLDLMSIPSATETWWALPEAKRHRIEQAALHTFATYGYDQASLTQLVADLGIAKGSLYQYFDGGKLGLFVHLMQEGGRRKVAAMRQVVPEEPAPGAHIAAPADGDPGMQRLRAMYLQGLRFWREEPLFAAVFWRLEMPSREPALRQLAEKSKSAGRAFVRSYLESGQAAGTIRTDIPLTTLTELVYGTVSVGLLRSLFIAAGMGEAFEPSNEPLALSDEQLMAIIDHALAYVHGGVRAR